MALYHLSQRPHDSGHYCGAIGNCKTVEHTLHSLPVVPFPVFGLEITDLSTTVYSLFGS